MVYKIKFLTFFIIIILVNFQIIGCSINKTKVDSKELESKQSESEKTAQPNIPQDKILLIYAEINIENKAERGESKPICQFTVTETNDIWIIKDDTIKPDVDDKVLCAYAEYRNR